LSTLAAFLFAASTVSGEMLRGGFPAQRVVPGAARAARSAATLRPLAPGETRFVGVPAAPFVGNVRGVGATGLSGMSRTLPRLISLSGGSANSDRWTDTVVVASSRPDSSRLDAILTGHVVRIALDRP
jgi:hypothetical protein